MFIYVCANAPNNAQKIIIITISITIIMIMITIRYDVRKCVCVCGRTTPYKYESFRSTLKSRRFPLAFVSHPLPSSSPSDTVFSSFLVCVAEHITRTLYSIANVAFIGALK